MKFFFRFLTIWLLVACAQSGWSQQEAMGPKINKVNVQFIGPSTVNEQFVLSHVQLKPGGTYLPSATESDIHALYATGQFYNIRANVQYAADGGINLTYVVQVKPRLTEIKIAGNERIKESKIRKQIKSKVGLPLNEEQLFTDTQAITDLYEKKGYPGTVVKYIPDIDEAAGTGTATFQIKEGRKIKITKIEFVGATAFSQRTLRHQLKTRQRWMFSWITQSDNFKPDQFEDDKQALGDFYRSHGFLDFEIKDVRFLYPTPNTMTIQIVVFEGKQYRVGNIFFSGTTLLNTNAIRRDFKPGPAPKPKYGPAYMMWARHIKFNNDFAMKSGDVYTPDGLNFTNVTAIENFYGSLGYINVRRGDGLKVQLVPNVDLGTMDLEFAVDEGHKYHVEKIEIRGNLKTKDRVIRRELSIAPGDVFDMVRVKLSQTRLENMSYFENVDLRPQPTEPPIAGRQDLVVNVNEKSTGNFTVGAGYSSVESFVAFAQVSQINFDLFNPPYFTGAGQQFNMRVQLGSQDREYSVGFVEPWFLNRKLALGVDFYRNYFKFDSPNDVYDESRTGARVSLTRALWSDFLRGSVFYNLEGVGITLNNGWHGVIPGTPVLTPANVPPAILEQTGSHLFNRFGATLTYDTRNSLTLPNWGQLSEIDPTLSVGDSETYYKVELKTAWFFPSPFKKLAPSFFKGHVLEIDGHVGTARSLNGPDVPFYDRYYLGGIYDLRGFKYRNIAPRQPNPNVAGTFYEEPVGGDSYWYTTAEYSLPIFEQPGGVGLRFAMFADAGSVGPGPWSFSGNYNSDWGLGIRLNIPRLGPLRIDYGIPITHDKFNGSSGQFQFSAGYQHPF
jgi:outer membrane protein insertion porin family